MPKQTKTTRPVKPKTQPQTYQLGELVSVAFEQALAVTKDPKQAAKLASLVVERMLSRDNRASFTTQLAFH